MPKIKRWKRKYQNLKCIFDVIEMENHARERGKKMCTFDKIACSQQIGDVETKGKKYKIKKVSCGVTYWFVYACGVKQFLPEKIAKGKRFVRLTELEVNKYCN